MIPQHPPPHHPSSGARVGKGRQMDTATAETLSTIDRFNDAFNRHDVDAVMALMTDDVVFENTSPPPDGERHEGQAAVRAFWESFFAGSPRAPFAGSERVLGREVRPRGSRGKRLPKPPGC